MRLNRYWIIFNVCNINPNYEDNTMVNAMSLNGIRYLVMRNCIIAGTDSVLFVHWQHTKSFYIRLREKGTLRGKHITEYPCDWRSPPEDN